jgi:hypothetical protein
MFPRAFRRKDAPFDVIGRAPPILLLAICTLILPTTGYAEKSYVDAVQLESEKLEDAGTSDEQSDAPQTATDDSVEKFEQELEARYRGTYLFYTKLPARSREEVFLEHKQGASIEEVRATIMSRYLHEH